MGAGASAQQLLALSAQDVAAEVVRLGSAYAPYETGIVANGLDGDVLAHLPPEQLPALLDTLGITNPIHMTKLRSLYDTHRPSLLKRTLSMAQRLDEKLNQSPRKPKAFDVFLSHNWGHDELHRDNHARVSKINAFLRARKLRTWFDEDQMAGNILKAMANGIEESQIVIVFVTQSYQNKVNGDNANDNCQLEFGMANATQTPQWMVPVVMEPCMLSPAHWSGQLKLVLGNQLYIDLAGDDATSFTHGCQNLLQRIEALLGKLGMPPMHSHRSSQDTLPPSSPRTNEDSELTQHLPAWQEAIETGNLELEADTVAAVVDQLSSLPQDTALTVASFPWPYLVHALEAPSVSLQDDACAMGVLLLDLLPTAADALLALPAVLQFLMTATTVSGDDWPRNAMVLLCNLSALESAAPTLLGSPVLDRLLTWMASLDASVPDETLLPRLETVANLAPCPLSRPALSPHYTNLVALMLRRPQLAWCTLRIFLHVADDTASAVALVDAGICDAMLSLAPRPDEMVLKVASHLVQHACAAVGIGTSAVWCTYLLQQASAGALASVSHRVVAGLSVDPVAMTGSLACATEWLGLWEAAPDKTALTILCNLSLIPEWAPLLSCRSTLLEAVLRAAKDGSDVGAAMCLANLLAWANETATSVPELYDTIIQGRPIWVAWSANESGDEARAVADQLLQVLATIPAIE
ncbi:hypothetical protein ACHHYP_05582 [Achlya hypogyna]|uniref:TIR domain-containing protein n=1 Tax=Achlya hypogyna TaxID=1202772 RepID=A0A1V9YX44_ACHHY|nr:hypothetical protein ACHHYP_05582 [Achlya hypogyna]